MSKKKKTRFAVTVELDAEQKAVLERLHEDFVIKKTPVSSAHIFRLAIVELDRKGQALRTVAADGEGAK